VAEPIEISDPADVRLADYRDLRDVSLRKHLESAEGLFIAEGEKIVRRAITAGFHARSFLMAPRWLAGLSVELAASAAPCYVVAEEIAEQITGFHVHRGALASLHRQPTPSVQALLATANRVLVLEDIVDHTNVGAMFRNAAAFGFDAVLISPRCADPLYRRSIKVAMGAVFAIPWAKLTSWDNAMEVLANAGFTTVAITLAAGADDLEDVAVNHQKVALVLGSEGPGISPHWQASSAIRAVIPMAAGVDSLNVAAACAVACYVVSRGSNSSR
jgi:tRNA G18 (ribose-2'-O)-methylase SpoU